MAVALLFFLLFDFSLDILTVTGALGILPWRILEHVAHRCLESGQGSKDFPLRCEVYSRFVVCFVYFFFLPQNIQSSLLRMLIIGYFSAYHFEDEQKVSDNSHQFQCTVVDKFQSYKVKLKKSMNNYRTNDISDIALHFNF